MGYASCGCRYPVSSISDPFAATEDQLCWTCVMSGSKETGRGFGTWRRDAMTETKSLKRGQSSSVTMICWIKFAAAWIPVTSFPSCLAKSSGDLLTWRQLERLPASSIHCPPFHPYTRSHNVHSNPPERHHRRHGLDRHLNQAWALSHPWITT